MKESSSLRAAINRVMDHVESNLDQKLSLDSLAQVAHISPHHFHRVFRASCGETLHSFIFRQRMERAALQLQNNPQLSLMDLALSVGYETHASFTKAFTKHFGESPSQYKKKAKSKIGQVLHKNGTALPEQRGYIEFRSREHIWHGGDGEQKVIGIEQCPIRYFAYLRYVGPYQGDGTLFQNLWTRFSRWAAPRGLFDPWESGPEYLAVYHNSPELTPDPLLRVSIGVTSKDPVEAKADFGSMELSAGTYCSVPFVVGAKDYAEAWDWVYAVWLPQSGYIPGQGPAFERFHDDSSDLPPGKHRVDICLPITVAPF